MDLASVDQERVRLLVVDDSRFERLRLRRQFMDDAMTILEASDGPAGLRAAREERPDLILLDLRLPGLDGFETLRRLKDDPATQSIPVIYFSSTNSTSDKARGLDLGAADFVSKPADPIELRARLFAALRHKRRHDALEARALRDGLTGLANRHALDERLRADWVACRGAERPLALWITDLDHFKRINDAHGHAVGDHVLRAAADCLRASVRATDCVARFGGEEFVVVARDCGLSGAAKIAARFRAALSALDIPAPDTPLRATVSVGVASAFDPVPIEPETLLVNADRALYQAKQSGRNSVWVWNREPGRAQPFYEQGRL
jgi:diguanylate cyclase (GGDEF)-like protein